MGDMLLFVTILLNNNLKFNFLNRFRLYILRLFNIQNLILSNNTNKIELKILNFTIFIKYIFLQLKKIILKNIFLAYNIFILVSYLEFYPMSLLEIWKTRL